MTDFKHIVPALADAIRNRGYETLTPVQSAVLAPELEDKDLLVSAQTGSGKTVAFGMAMAPQLLDGEAKLGPAGMPLALIIAPTRELALQVKRELEWLFAPAGGRFASCVGGMNMSDERRALRSGAHFVVGTPGRLRDHIDRGSLKLDDLKVAVLDEADEMLNMGFREELEAILSATPESRRTLMFSATVPSGIAKLAKKYQDNAQRINVAAGTEQHVDIEYKAIGVGPKDSENAIINVLRYFDAKNAIVFCATRAAVNRMTSRFNNRGFSVVALSGELSQKDRTHALQAMRDGRARVCIATDVAARGIDLPDLELVIHADIPKNREVLLHRSGRTGRAGRKGVCALIVPHPARRRTERLLRDANIEASWEQPPTAAEVLAKDDERLLAEPNLSKKSTKAEYEFAEKLIERYGALQIAAAYIHLYRAGNSAPEELSSTRAYDPAVHERGGGKGGKGRKRGPRNDSPRSPKSSGKDYAERGRKDRGTKAAKPPRFVGNDEDYFTQFADTPPETYSELVDKPKKPHKKKLAKAAARAAKAGGKPEFAGKPKGKPSGKPSGIKPAKKGPSGKGGDFKLKRKKRSKK